jgi:4,5-dihydroxyphthalate decarboxylase
LSLAISHYDLVADLTAGRIPVEGIDLTCLNLEITDIFYRSINHREFDISEMSFAKYASMISQGDNSFVGIPVFPSRIFRHSCIYVRRDGPIKSPADMRGRRIGLPEWAQTAQLFAKGFLVHQFDVDLKWIEWVQAGVNEPGRTEKVALNLPAGIRLKPEPSKTLNAMLVTGEIDAAMTAHPPACFEQPHPNIRRLFENYMQIEEGYYAETRIFPIMHLVAIRQEVVRENPWVPGSLFTAFCEARRRSIERALYIDASRFPIPWGHALAEQAREKFGELWPYGIEDNRVTLAAALQFGFEQGICHRRLLPEDLFPKQLHSRSRT